MMNTMGNRPHVVLPIIRRRSMSGKACKLSQASAASITLLGIHMNLPVFRKGFEQTVCPVALVRLLQAFDHEVVVDWAWLNIAPPHVLQQPQSVGPLSALGTCTDGPLIAGRIQRAV